MSNMRQKYYCEAIGSDDDQWKWKIYHYDDSGQKELIDATQGGYATQPNALDAACEWMEENNIDAEIM